MYWLSRFRYWMDPLIGTVHYSSQVALVEQLSLSIRNTVSSTEYRLALIITVPWASWRGRRTRRLPPRDPAQKKRLRNFIFGKFSSMRFRIALMCQRSRQWWLISVSYSAFSRKPLYIVAIPASNMRFCDAHICQRGGERWFVNNVPLFHC